MHAVGPLRRADRGEPAGGDRPGRDRHADLPRGRPTAAGARGALRPHPCHRGLADRRRRAAVTWRMGAAALSLVGVFVAAYLYLYKLGLIGSLACGTGGCETVQFSEWSRFLGVEVSLIGLVGYVGLLGLSLASLQGPLAGRRWPVQLLAVLSGI